MHDYDAALKLLLQASAESLLSQLSGGVRVTEWLATEYRDVQLRHADLVGRTMAGGLIHIELQSTNDHDMALRMAEYALSIYRHFGELPKQVVLYVGEARLRMKAVLNGPDPLSPDFAFRYTLLDIREFESDPLLASRHVEDNVLAILTRSRNQAATVRQILGRIATLLEPARGKMLAEFLIISGLRRLSQTVKEEARKMPILNSILDHEVLGPAILQGRREGRREGREEGREEGRQEIVRKLLEKRFGSIPDWVSVRLAALAPSELDEIAIRLLDVASMEELFPEKS